MTKSINPVILSFRTVLLNKKKNDGYLAITIIKILKVELTELVYLALHYA
jgi:hypothetical protein